MNLTLTFDPMTLTSLKILALVDVYPSTKFGFNPTNSTGVITNNVRLLLSGEFDLDTSSDDLDLYTAP